MKDSRHRRLTLILALVAAALAITAAALNWTQDRRVDWLPIVMTAFMLALAWSVRRKEKE